VKNILKNRKDEIINNIGEDLLKQLKKIKLLDLLKFQVKEMSVYWTLGQILEQINNEFNLSISKTLFYDFCSKNIEKDKLEHLKKDKKIETGVSQNKDTKKESILSEDELNVVAMFGSSSKNQVKD
jgi:hypothetical protein